MPCWLEIAQGLLTPLIAIITTYIAIQQWRSSELKLKMDKYERRLTVYRETQKFIAQVTRDFKPALADLYGFYAATAEADFVYRPEIREYLDEVYSRATKLWCAQEQYCDYTQTAPAGYDHNKICDVLAEQSEWFVDQHQRAPAKFKPFLDISKWV